MFGRLIIPLLYLNIKIRECYDHAKEHIYVWLTRERRSMCTPRHPMHEIKHCLFSLKRRSSSGSLAKAESEDQDIILSKSDVILSLNMDVSHLAEDIVENRSVSVFGNNLRIPISGSRYGSPRSQIPSSK